MILLLWLGYLQARSSARAHLTGPEHSPATLFRSTWEAHPAPNPCEPDLFWSKVRVIWGHGSLARPQKFRAQEPESGALRGTRQMGREPELPRAELSYRMV